MIRDLLSQIGPVLGSAVCLTAPAWLPALYRWARRPRPRPR